MICRVYKLTSPHTDLVYVGSTIQTLNARLSEHRKDYRAGRGCGSCELSKLGEYDVKIELLEEIEIDHKRDPKRCDYEQKWIDCTENTCNILRADKEYKKKYRQKTKEYWNEYNREHYQKNKEYLFEKIPCECGSVITRTNMTRHKKTQKHKDYMAAKKPKLKITIIKKTT